MTKKEEYIAIELEVIRFAASNIVTESDGSKSGDPLDKDVTTPWDPTTES